MKCAKLCVISTIYVIELCPSLAGHCDRRQLVAIISTLHNSATYYSPSLLATLRTIITQVCTRGG